MCGCIETRNDVTLNSKNEIYLSHINILDLTVECPVFIWLQCHSKWLGDIRDIGGTVSPLGILRF